MGNRTFGAEVTSFVKLDEDFYKMVRHAFRLRRANPVDPIAAGNLYGAVVNKITFHNMVRAGKAGLTWDVEGIKTHMELSTVKNTRQTGYHEGVYQKFEFSPVPVPMGLHADILDA